MKSRVVVGKKGFDEAAQAFVSTWKRAEAGQPVEPERIFTFESYEAFSAAMTPERCRLLIHLHRRPEPSVLALATHLNRGYRRVHGDVVALEKAGLIERSSAGVRATADRVTVEIDLTTAAE